MIYFFFFFKQKTAYEIPKRDWSSDVCSSDLVTLRITKQEKLIIAPAPKHPDRLAGRGCQRPAAIVEVRSRIGSRHDSDVFYPRRREAAVPDFRLPRRAKSRRHRFDAHRRLEQGQDNRRCLALWRQQGLWDSARRKRAVRGAKNSKK